MTGIRAGTGGRAPPPCPAGECLHSPRGGKTGRRLAQDLVRLPELAVLPLQLLDPRPIRARRPRPRPLIALGLPHPPAQRLRRSEEHTSELQSLMRSSYAVFCLKKKKRTLITLGAQPVMG